MKEILASRLKWLREKNRYSQRDIAEKINMTLNGYQKIEYGDREPKLDVLVSLCDIFKVSADFILGRNDNTSKLTELSKQFYAFQKEMTSYQDRINDIREKVVMLQQAKMETQLFAGTDNIKKLEHINQSLRMNQDQLDYLQYNLHESHEVRQSVILDYILEIYSIPCSKPEKDGIVKNFLPLDVVIDEKLDNAYTIRLKSLNGTDLGIIGMARNTENLDESFNRKLTEYRELFRLN